MEGLAKEHPHHCLWHLIALANGAKVPASQRGATRFVADEDKVGLSFLILSSVFCFANYPSQPKLPQPAGHNLMRCDQILTPAEEAREWPLLLCNFDHKAKYDGDF